jgi:hypothetical protein
MARHVFLQHQALWHLTAPPKNGIHPTADTESVILREWFGVAGDARHYAAFIYLTYNAEKLSLADGGNYYD